jgi:hypothetical protein
MVQEMVFLMSIERETLQVFLNISQVFNVSTFGNMADIYAIVHSIHTQKICDLSANCSSLSSAHCSSLKGDLFLLQQRLSFFFNWGVNLPCPIHVLQNFFTSTFLNLKDKSMSHKMNTTSIGSH